MADGQYRMKTDVMVLTRKRSYSEQGSSSAACGTPRDKVKRGNNEGPVAGTPQVSPRDVAPAAPGTPNTRTRRCTDTALSTPPPRTTRSSRNATTTTLGKLLKDSHVEDRLVVTPVSLKKASIVLKDITTSPAVTPRRSSRRTSGGGPNLQDTPIVTASTKRLKDADSGQGTPAGSTPVRRSRRLSAGMVEDNTTQQIPSKLSFSIASITGNEGESSDEGTKNQRALPIIKEDAEQPDTTNSVAQPEPKDSGARPEPKDSEAKSQNQESQDSLLNTVTTPMKYGTATPSAPQPMAEKATSSSDSAAEDCRETPSPDSTASDQTQTPPSDSAAAGQMKKEIKYEEEPTDSDESNIELPTTKVGLQTAKDPKKEGSEPENPERSQEIEMSKLTKEAQSNIHVSPASHAKEASPALCTAGENGSSSEGAACIRGSEEEKKVQVTNGHCDENANTENEVTSTSSLPTVAAQSAKKVSEDEAQLEQKMEQFRKVPRGLPVSGRWWKKEKQRFRTVYKDATGKKSWAKKMQMKRQREDTLARSAAIEAEKQKKRDDLKERQRINKIRREENAKKSEIVQVIKDPRKIKKMKRKQLRYIQTRDTTSLTTV